MTDYVEVWYECFSQMRSALIELVYENAPFVDGAYTTGESLPLKRAFKLLGWRDPHSAPPEWLCNSPGCKKRWSVYIEPMDLHLCAEHCETVTRPPTTA